MAIGAAVGGVARWAITASPTPRVGAAIPASTSKAFPWRVIAVNMAGSLVLGVVLGRSTGSSQKTKLLVGTGFCGALTTFSTFAVDVVQLCEASRFGAAAGCVAATNVGSIAAAAAGYMAAKRWSSPGSSLL